MIVNVILNIVYCKQPLTRGALDVSQTDRCTAAIALLLIYILDQPLLHVRHSRYFLLLRPSIAHNAVIRTNRVHLVHQLLAHYCWMTLIS